MRRVSMLLLLLSVFHLGFSFSSEAQDSHTQKLIDGAKKEGALVWYMSASIEDAKAILLAFNKKYPFLKTDFFRAGSARLFNRIMNEARAGKVLFDLVAVRGLETHQLVKAGLLNPTFLPRAWLIPPASRTRRDIGSTTSIPTT